MAIKVNNVLELKEHFLKVVDRAENHVPAVNEIIYPLLGFIILIMDDKSDIQVRANEGDSGNMLWLSTNGRRYAFRYEESSQSIVIRKGSFTGESIAKVNNSTSTKHLKQVFSQL